MSADHSGGSTARIRAQDQARKEATAQSTEAREADAQRVKLIGRLRRTPAFRTTAAGKLVGKFPFAVHLENGETAWHDVLAFGDRAATLQKRLSSRCAAGPAPLDRQSPPQDSLVPHGVDALRELALWGAGLRHDTRGRMSGPRSGAQLAVFPLPFGRRVPAIRLVQAPRKR
jgi:hypothetical protein